MVEIKVNEILNWFYSDYQDQLVQVHHIKEKTLEECFQKVYALRRSRKYDNCRKYVFQDQNMEEEYLKWKSKNETIEMFYGSATVD